MVAINDGIVLEACIYRILKKHLGWVGAPLRAAGGCGGGGGGGGEHTFPWAVCRCMWEARPLVLSAICCCLLNYFATPDPDPCLAPCHR